MPGMKLATSYQGAPGRIRNIRVPFKPKDTKSITKVSLWKGTIMKKEEPSRSERLKSERRLVRILVNLDLFANSLLAGVRGRIKVEGLPEDAVFMGTGFSAEYYGVFFYYAHESFEPVEIGTVLPQRDVTVTQLDNFAPTVRAIKSTDEVKHNETWVKVKSELFAISLEQVITAAKNSPDTNTKAEKNAHNPS